MTNILIIGASGRMGKWFFEYFLKLRKKTENNEKNIFENFYLYDVKEIEFIGKDNHKKVLISRDLAKDIPQSKFILFCTPIEETIKLLQKHKHLFKKGTTIIEISSIKQPIYELMSDILNKSNVIPLSIHPMFGPGASYLSKKNKILHIPVNTSKIKEELNLIDNLFPYYEKITINNPKDHDRAISIVISLIYFINLIFSRLLLEISNDAKSGMDSDIIPFIKKISGSSFKIQSLLSESIMVDDVNLFVNLFMNNRQTKKILENYGEIFDTLLSKLKENDIDFLKKFVLDTKKEITQYSDINKSYSQLYQLLDKCES